MKTRPCLWLVPAWLTLLIGCATNSHRTSPPEAGGSLRLAFITCARDAKVFEPVKRGT